MKQKYASVAWLIWGLAALFYFLDYLARVAPSVMHHRLQIAFGMNEIGFCMLTASFYLPYIAMQIPVGLAVDRVSIRYILTVMSGVTALGCAVFACAQDLFVASIGRILIGFSAAFAFVSALRLATTWFPPAMLGLLAGFTQALGMLGAAAGDAPVSYLVAAVGWRNSLWIMTAVFIGLAGLLFQFIFDAPRQQPVFTREPVTRIRDSLKTVLGHRQTWLNALYTGFLFAPSAVIGESLGPAYLQFGYGLSAHRAAFATGLIFIGWGVGGPITGWLSDRVGRRKPLLLASALCGIVLVSLLVYLPHMSFTLAYTLLFLYGFTNTGVAISYAVSTELHHKNETGTAIAFTNMASILIGALMQPLVGYMIDWVAGSRAYDVTRLTLHDFQGGFKLLPFCSLVALMLSLGLRETYCRPISAYDKTIPRMQ